MEFPFPFPFPKIGNEIFIPVPKSWEWAEPFPLPFPNVQKSFPLTPALGAIKASQLFKTPLQTKEV